MPAQQPRGARRSRHLHDKNTWRKPRAGIGRAASKAWPIAAQPNISASLLERRLQSRSSRVPDRPTLPMTVRGRDREGHVRSAPGPAAGKETDHAQDLQLLPSVARDPHRRGCGRAGATCRALTRASSDRLRAPAIAPAIRAVLQVHPLAARQGRGVPRADPTLRRNHGMAGGGCSSLDLGTKLTRPDGDVSFVSPERVYPSRWASVHSLHRGHAKGGAFAAPIRLSIGTVNPRRCGRVRGNGELLPRKGASLLLGACVPRMGACSGGIVRAGGRPIDWVGMKAQANFLEARSSDCDIPERMQPFLVVRGRHRPDDRPAAMAFIGLGDGPHFYR